MTKDFDTKVNLIGLGVGDFWNVLELLQLWELFLVAGPMIRPVLVPGYLSA